MLATVLRSRRVGIASTLVLVLLAGLLTWFATRAEGETVRRAELNDGGIWVTNSAQARFGRINKPAGQLDAAVAAPTPENTGFDVVQDGAAVVGIAKATNQAIPVNVRAGSLVESAALTLPTPAPGVPVTQSPVDLRGGTLAVVEPATGKVRAQRVDPAVGIGLLDRVQSTAPVHAQVGAGAVLAVGVDGTAYAVSAGGQLAVVRPTAAGDFAAADLADLGFTATTLQLTVVGTRWVVLDTRTGLLRVDGVRSPIDLRARLAAQGAGPGTELRLQQPGPDADAVVVATNNGAYPVPISGDSTMSGVLHLPAAAKGRIWVAAPVRIGSCVHGAWADAGAVYYARSCSSADSEAVTIPGRLTANAAAPAAPVSADGVALRVNRGLVVLNDLDTGALWDVDSPKPVKIDDWTSVIPPPKAGTANQQPDPSNVDDQQVRRPPEANPDVLNVRPGRTSTLHVLDNDTDSTGAVLAISPGDVSVPDVPGVLVSPSVDGQTISISVPAQPAARVVHFSYTVNNGTSGAEGRASTTVTVSVVGDEVNTAPRRRPGEAKLAATRTPVIRGGHVAVTVLADWRDDESDPLVVEAVDPGTSIDAAGAIAVTAPPEPGHRDLRYAVADGRGGRAEDRVGITVLGDSDRPVAPVAQADVVRAVQGKPVQLQPLGNDIPGADPTDPTARLRLAAEVRGPTQLLVDTNLETGVVTVTGSAPGSYLLTYAAQVGSAVGAGRFRVDIMPPPTDEAPPVAAPDAATVRDQSPTVVDVLANDYSPRSDVLVIQSVATTDPWVRAWVVQGKWLRVQSTSPLPPATQERRGTVAYTISDGTRTATGELSVVHKPSPPSAVLPTVVDDQATVRWGDVVTIAVLDNDSMAEGVPLRIQPGAVKVVTGGGEVYPTGSVLRYVPPAAPLSVERVATLEYAAYPEGMAERAVTARVTVTIKPLPTPQTPNQPPTARNFSASVTAGEAITLTVPTSGIDPDGDLGFVTGIVGEQGGAVNLRLGRVTSFGASSIRYEAYPLSAGTEVIRYVVTDRFGKTGEGLIRVGVVQPGAPQPPVAVPDEVVAAPGRTVQVDVLANDLITRSTDVVIEDPATSNEPAVVADFVKQPDNTFKVVTPQEGPAKVLVYGINGGLFDTSRATVTVRGRNGFNNPPTAVDDVARAAPPAAPPPPAEPTPTDGTAPPAVTTAVVDVLANDRDLDGDRSALEVVEVGEGATITPQGVRVTFADHPRAVPYVVRDADGGRAMALIYVPANGSDAPYLLEGKTVTLAQDSSATITLADYVGDPRGRTVRITTPDGLSTSPAGQLSVRAGSATELTLTASGGYVGPAALMLEVTDRTGPDDPSPRVAYLVIPVQVGPLTPLLRCPSWEVNVTAGADPRSVDVPRLCSAWFPAGLDPDSVDYVAEWQQPAEQVTLTQTGAGGRVVRVTAGDDATHGELGSFVVGVRGQTERFPLRVRVTSLKVAPAPPGVEAPPPPPLAVLRPARVEGLIAGQSQVVNLAPYLDSPFGTLRCSIEAVRVSSGAEVSGSGTGCVLTVSADPGARGSTVLTIDVSDAPDRVATGTVTVSVLSRPDPPPAVSAVADRVQGGSARVSWSPPPYDGGLPILEYQVAAPGVTLSCGASPCTVTGLTNGVDYLFSVRARNAAGWGEPGLAGAPARPDTAPGPVSLGAVTAGDRSLVVAWEAPANQGSAIDLYTVQAVSLTGGPGGGSFQVPGSMLTTTISGLVNNDEYSIRVQAHNDAGWGPYGPARTAQSVGTPPPVAAPTLDYPRPSPSDSAATVRISWPDTDPNGPPIVSYTVWAQVNGGAWASIATVSASNSNVVSDVVPYDGRTVAYAVTAVNGGGKESVRTNAASFQAIGVPEAPRAPSVATNAADETVLVSGSLGASRTTGWSHVLYETSGGQSGRIDCTTPDCSVTFPIVDQANRVQTVAIRGCTRTGTCSDPSPASREFQTYGPTQPVRALNPQVTGSKGKFGVTFSWELVTNGRPVTVSVVSSEGTCRVERDQTSCVVDGLGYSTRVTVNVTAESIAGPATTVAMSVGTPDKVPARVSLSPGAVCYGPACGGPNLAQCTDNSCARIKVTSTAWDATSMVCVFSVGGTEIGRDNQVATNTTEETSVAWGQAGTVTASCRNTATGEVATAAATWKDYPKPTPPPPTTTPPTTPPPPPTTTP